MKNFKKQLMLAKMGDAKAIQEIVDMYRWLIIKESSVYGIFDEDLNQQLFNTLLNCIKVFNI